MTTGEERFSAPHHTAPKPHPAWNVSFLLVKKRIVLQKTQNNPASLGGARRIFLEKARKMLFLKSYCALKSKSWEMNLPDPLFFFTNKNYTFQAGCG
ncbi:MAG: hypothetical protein H7834_06800 [Magnetococcus sp. YQC-9]